ncbi:MAG: metal-transporting ATPase, partial [Clostridia bacterium]|nr:metal-transporting ATPase [Clostridia bacterium]
GIVLDKTGTLTEGKMSVQEVIPAPGVNTEAFLLAALSLEKTSEHPVAAAVVAYAEKQGLSPKRTQNFRSHPGKGVSAEMDGETYRAGTALWMQEEKIDLSLLQSPLRHIQEKGYSVLCFAKNRRALGLIGVSDTLKPSAKEAVASLKALGVTPYMLTGDQRRAAAHIAGECGVENVLAEVLPQDKEREVRKIQEQGRRVAMIGDGINDAPALARADVGVAIGAGTDVAIESADVVLMKSDLLDAVNAIRLSHNTIRNIKQNLFWAFFYNCIGIPIAAGVFFLSFGLKLSPMFGAAAMSLSSVCVVSNALRLRFFKPIHRNTPEASAVPIRKEETQMTKTISIEGMMCTHCSGRVTKALESIPGVSGVQVSHETGKAVVTVDGTVANGDLSKAVEEAGYTVLGID